MIKKAIFVSVCYFLCVFPGISGNIHDAAAKGDLDTVKALIAKNPEIVNKQDTDARTPLHWACRGVHFEILKYLVEVGADVNAQDINLVAPLHSLAVRNHVDGIQFLLEKKANINILDYGKNTPLHYASMLGCKDAVALLVSKGADLEIRENYGRTALLLCARERGGPEVTKILIEAGADVNARDRFGDSSLDLAAWRGYFKVVDILLENGAEVPIKGRKGKELLLNSARKGLWSLFTKMNKAGADLNVGIGMGGSLLHAAAAGGSIEIVRDLIKAGLDAGQKDSYGWTPLHYAAKEGQKEVAAELMERGIDINTRNFKGQTPYNVAQENGKKEFAEMLLLKGASPDPMAFPEMRGDYMGQTPPKDEPELFGLGIVTSIWGLHSTIVFSPDGNEALWTPMVDIPGSGYSLGIIYRMKRKNNLWFPPEVAAFSGKYDDDVPFYSPDGKKLYFISNRPLPGQKQGGKENIWVMGKKEGAWAEPVPLDEALNEMQMHWQFSVDKKGNLYFSSNEGGGLGMGDIYVSRFIDGYNTKPENLGSAINSDRSEETPFIAPDGSYLIFSRNQDFYISFQKKDNTWTTAENMGRSINTLSHELCPVVSADGEYLFFMSSRHGKNGAYWVRADIIEKIKARVFEKKEGAFD